VWVAATRHKPPISQRIAAATGIAEISSDEPYAIVLLYSNILEKLLSEILMSAFA